MNPLTLVKRIQNINSKEAALGISEGASWHAKYKDSAYVYVGGIPFDLTEGDLLAVFAQYGDIVDCNLVRDKGTGKSKGFAFVAYEDQRSTNLAVDNLNGAQVLGRTIRVDHVTKYKKKEEEDEETQQLKREAAGVCRAFQKGECTRGAGCKFSHDEQRAANTGWGAPEDKDPRWGHDKYEGPKKSERRPGASTSISETLAQERKSRDTDTRSLSTKSSEGGKGNCDYRPRESNRDEGYRDRDKRSERRERESNHRDDLDKRAAEKSSRRGDAEPNSREDYDRRDEKRSRRYYDRESYRGEERDKRGSDSR